MALSSNVSKRFRAGKTLKRRPVCQYVKAATSDPSVVASHPQLSWANEKLPVNGLSQNGWDDCGQETRWNVFFGQPLNLPAFSPATRGTAEWTPHVPFDAVPPRAAAAYSALPRPRLPQTRPT